MNQKNKALSLLLSIISLVLFSHFQINAIDPALAQLSPAELEQLQQEQIAAIQAMTPAERESFEQQMLQAMPPEERMKYELFKKDLEQKTPEQQFEFLLKPAAEQEAYINQLYEKNVNGPAIDNSQFPGFGAPGLPAPSLSTVEEKKPEEPKKVIEPKKRDKALGSISGIIDATADFLQRVNSMPEFLGKFEKWVKQGKLHDIPSSETWETLRNKIETFISELKTIQEKDKKTKEYRYLTDLVEDEALFNNIVALNAKLQMQKDQFAQIDKKETDDEAAGEGLYSVERAFGIQSASKEIREVMRTVINAFIEAFEKTKLLEGIKAIKQKYDPVAQKLKETEEETRKRAFEESKRERRPEYTVVGGKSDDVSSFSMPTNYSGFEYPSGYLPTSPYPDSAKSQEEKKEDKKPEPAKSGGEKAPEQKKEKDKTLLEIIKTFRESLAEAVDKNISGSSLETIGQHMRDDSEADTEAASSNLPAAIRAIKSAANTLRGFKKRIAKGNKGGSDEYVKLINDANDSYQETLDTVYKQIAEAKNNKGLASQAKREAFFGPRNNLSDLQNAIDELRAARRGMPFTPAPRVTVNPTVKPKEDEKKSLNEAKPLTPGQTKAKESVDKIKKRFDDNITSAFIDAPQSGLEKIQEHIERHEAPKPEITEGIAAVIKGVDGALSNLANLKANLKKLDAPMQAEIRANIQVSYDEFEDTINKIYSGAQWAIAHRDQLTREQAESYLERGINDEAREADEAGPARAPQNNTLNKAKEAIDKLRAAIQAI